MPFKLDFTRPVQTRDGREVRIYATDGEGDHPIHGAIKFDRGWGALSWAADGSNFIYQHFNLIQVPQRIKRTMWVNVYPTFVGMGFDSREIADAQKGSDRIACVQLEIDVEEGHGL